MRFDFGEVVRTPFPFTSQTASKRRPAVIISNQTYNGNRPDIVVMAITSQFRPVLSQNDIWVSEWKAAAF
jgi:mRNA interferase MazF